MGGGGSHSVVVPAQQENPYLKQLAAMSSGLWSQTQPIRDVTTNEYFMPFLEGNYKPETMPGFAPGYDLLRGSLEDQYKVGKQNILANTARGGAMTNAMTQLESDRARQTGLGASQLGSSLISDLWNKAYNTGWVTGPQQALSGQSSAASINQSGLNSYQAAQMQAQQMMAQQAAQDQAGKTSGLGLAGMGIGSLLGQTLAAPSSSIMGSGLSGLKGGSTSGFGGYASTPLLNQAMGLPMFGG